MRTLPPDPLLLVIGYVWPEPNSSAAGRHMLSLIRLFKNNGWTVHYASPAARGEHEYDLEQEEVSTHQIKLNCSSFDEFITPLAPTAVLFDRFMMEEQFGWRVAKTCPSALRILDMEDLHSLRQARHTAIKQGKHYQEAELNTELAKREIASIFRSDLSLVISEAELNLLHETYKVPRPLLVHCPFLLEPSPKESHSYSEREHFISIGNFRHAPNWDAVLQLKNTIWPPIRRALPQAELHIYGAYPPPKALLLHNPKDGFLIKGWAQNSEKVMSAARICLAPLRFGAGLKGKLTEAMECGTPSITTSIGAEGIKGNNPWPGEICDNPVEFSQQAISLYEHEHKWVSMQKRATPLLKNRFNTEETSTRVLTQVSEILSNLTQHRNENFIGAMLQHHSMKATQYMSQWIEAKNR